MKQLNQINEIKMKINSFLNKASSLFMHDFYQVKEFQSKAHFRDLVTKTDKKIELLFSEWVKKNYPSHSIIGEEFHPAMPRINDWCWTIDPIDGTTNFIHQIPECAIIISVLYKKIPQLCWIIYPAKNEIYFAQKDGGAFLNNKKIQVQRGTDLSNSLIYSIAPRDFVKFSNIYKNIWEKTQGIRTIGCMAAGFTSICLGQNQISLLDKAYIWEYAAGCLLAQESGAVIKTIHGIDVDFIKHSEDLIIACSPELLKNVMNIVNQV